MAVRRGLRRRLERQWRSAGSDTDRVKYIDRLVVKRTDSSTSHKQVTSNVESKLLLPTGNNAGESRMNFCILVTGTKLELIPRTYTYLNHLLTISLVKVGLEK